MRGRWLTPAATPPAGSQYRLIRLPGDIDWQAPFWGALDELRKSSNWEQLLGISADDTSAIFAALYDEWRMPNPLIGTIFTHASSTAPVNSLPCDGATHNRSDYPDLFDSLDAAYRIGSTQFFTPDLRGRVIVGDGTGAGLTNRPFATPFGAETHVLTQPQLANHAHTATTAVVVPSLGGPGPAPASVVTVAAQNTGATGGNNPHNNMQPSLPLHVAIWAR
jgi:microcystin-dependent protein